VSLSSGYHQIYNKASWPLEEVKKRTEYQRLYKVVCAGCGKEVKVEGHRLLAKSFSVSIATKISD